MSELIYKRNGDYLLPEMGLTKTEKRPLGKYGMMRRQYLEENRPGMYTRLILSGRLMEHLQEPDRIATLEENILKLALTDAAQVIADEAYKLIV